MQRDGGRADGCFTGELKIIVSQMFRPVLSCNDTAGVSSDPVIAHSAVSVRGGVTQRSETQHCDGFHTKTFEDPCSVASVVSDRTRSSNC